MCDLFELVKKDMCFLQIPKINDMHGIANISMHGKADVVYKHAGDCMTSEFKGRETLAGMPRL